MIDCNSIERLNLIVLFDITWKPKLYAFIWPSYHIDASKSLLKVEIYKKIWGQLFNKVGQTLCCDRMQVNRKTSIIISSWHYMYEKYMCIH